MTFKLDKRGALISLLLCVALTFEGCSAGDGSTPRPRFNSSRRMAVHIKASLESLPKGAVFSAERMTALYEPENLDCGIFHPLKGGSIEIPRYPVEIKKDANGNFVYWKDLVVQDKCRWRLSTFDYVVYSGTKVALRMGFGEQGLETGMTFYCTWRGPIYGHCLRLPHPSDVTIHIASENNRSHIAQR